MARKKDQLNATTMNLKEMLLEKEQEFHGKDDIFSMTLLTNPGYISASRNIMFTSHLKQTVNLVNPDFPKVFTNYENIVGKYSTGYMKAKNNYVVIDKINKYMDNDFYYLLFVYDKENDKYDVIEKRKVENLTEKFGFEYNTEFMDSKEVGSKIDKGDVLFRSTSYDDDMNYCYGKNVKYMYALHPDTIEDAAVCSESLAKSLISKEVESVVASINDNDVLCNIYGNESVYKGFPDIGEYVKDKIVLAKRRIHNNQVLYDLKASNLRKINFSSDVLSFNNGRVVDIEIFSNKSLDELAESCVNEQLKKYILLQERFYTLVYERCKQIKESGSDYSKDINFFYKKAKEAIDKDVKWRKEESVFNNMMIRFVIERNVGLSIGQKITGRYGNKGVISRVLPDDQMPVLETGERVDLILNTLGVINRVSTFQLIEQSINFIMNRTVERMAQFPNVDDKEKLLFGILEILNEHQVDTIKDMFKNGVIKKEDFFKSIEENKYVNVHIPPLWEDNKTLLFDKISTIYKNNPWIKKYDVYVNKFGRKIKMMKPMVIGDMYVLKLKQTSEKGFSARSTGSLSKKGIPEKTNKAKIHQDLYPKTPIRMGDQENINLNIGADSRSVARLHKLYRTSVQGRKMLGEELLTGIDVGELSKDLPNRNIEILRAYFKSMGYKMVNREKFNVEVYDTSLSAYEVDNKLLITDREHYEDTMLKKKIRHETLGDLVADNDTVNEAVEKEFIKQKMKKRRLNIHLG